MKHFFCLVAARKHEGRKKVPTQYWYYANVGSLLLEKTVFQFLQIDQPDIIQTSRRAARGYIKHANKGAYAIFLKSQPAD